MNAGEKAILSTLCYADVFDYALSQAELWKYYIGKPTTLEKFRSALVDLLRQKLIFENKGFCVLKKRTSLVSLRGQRVKVAREKMKRAKRAALLLSFIPSVLLVGVSGALAMDNAPADDDIDLFIITAPNALWTTRFLATILLDLVRLRRRPGATYVKNMICLNMFVDASYLTLPKNERDLYSAHEVVQLQPIINKHQVHEQFLIANGWVRQYLPHAVKRLHSSHRLPRLWLVRLLARSEGVSRWFQLKYMSARRTREVVRGTYLRFHPRDARQWVLAAHEEKLLALLKTSRVQYARER